MTQSVTHSKDSANISVLGIRLGAFFDAGLAVLRSGNILALINVVNLRRARLVLGWVTVLRADKPSRYGTSQTRLTQPSTLRGMEK